MGDQQGRAGRAVYRAPSLRLTVAYRSASRLYVSSVNLPLVTLGLAGVRGTSTRLGGLGAAGGAQGRAGKGSAAEYRKVLFTRGTACRHEAQVSLKTSPPEGED